jgi:hypothetical protein
MAELSTDTIVRARKPVLVATLKRRRPAATTTSTHSKSTSPTSLPTATRPPARRCPRIVLSARKYFH